MVKEKTEVAQAAPLEEITLWSHPVVTISTLALCSVEWIQQGWEIARKHIVAIVIILSLIIFPHMVVGPHTPVVSAD